MLSQETEQELVEQRRALTARVKASGLYLHEPAEFEVAMDAYRWLMERLRVRSDLRSLATLESRNIVRLVILEDGTAAVLKVMGHGREPGEGEVLQRWRQCGLPVANPLDWGYVTCTIQGNKRTATYLLMAYIEGEPMTHQATDSLPNKEHQLEMLMDFIRPFHAAAPSIPAARSWEDRMWPHLRWTVPLIAAAGLPEPRDWRIKLRVLSDRGRILVHGDPAGGNVIRTSSGLMLLDPPGALLAGPEADVAQICSQVGGAHLTAHMVARACDLDRRLHPEALACLAGVNILVWAGYLLAGHDNPDVAEDRSGERARQVAEAESYVRLADTLIGTFDAG